LKSQVHAHGQINGQEQEILQRTLRGCGTRSRQTSTHRRGLILSQLPLSETIALFRDTRASKRQR
jgi:hypothetical protein